MNRYLLNDWTFRFSADLALKLEENPTEITITENEAYWLEIQNDYSQPVDVAVFNL